MTLYRQDDAALHLHLYGAMRHGMVMAKRGHVSILPKDAVSIAMGRGNVKRGKLKGKSRKLKGKCCVLGAESKRKRAYIRRVALTVAI